MPVVDEVAADYADDVAFVAVAGRGDLDATRNQAEQLFSDRLMWGLDDSIWEMYGIRGQPASVILVDGRVVDQWFGALGESELRARLDAVVG